MLYTITAKNCKISDKLLALIEDKSQKLAKRVNFAGNNQVLLRFNINKRNANEFYDADIVLGLPRRPIYAREEGWEAPEALIEKLFDHIFKELQKFKGKHLKSDSEYHSRDSIRYQEKII